MIKLPRHVYSPNSEASVSNDGKIPGSCKFPFLSSVIKFDNEMSEVKTKITIAQLLFMQSQNFVYSPNSEASVSNDGKIPGSCKFPFLSSVIKFDNEMSEVKTKITIAQLLFMQSQNLLSKTRSTLFITR